MPFIKGKSGNPKGRTPIAKVSISVYDKDGTRIWNYGKEISGSAFANDDDLIHIVMRKTSRRFPYTGY